MPSLKTVCAHCRLVLIISLALPALLPMPARANVARSDPSPPQEATSQAPLPATVVPAFEEGAESGTMEMPPVPVVPATPPARTDLVDRSDEVGAESPAPKEVIVSPAANAADLTVGNGCTYATIAAAIAAADPGDQLLIEGGVTFNEHLIVDKNLTIQGGYDGCASASTSATTVDGGASGSSVFDVSGGAVTLRNLQITGGSGRGAGVDATGLSRVTLDNVDVTGNHGTYGGGLFIGGTAAVTLTNDCEVHQNTASFAGGGAHVLGALTSMDTLSDINDNTAPHGGGVSAVGGQLLLVEADMSGNRATDPAGRGGAIYLTEGAVVTMTGNVWLYNANQAYDGAAIYADSSEVFLGTATIGGNVAGNWGGGICLTNGSTLSASGATVGSSVYPLGNQAASGAGIYANSSTITFRGNVYNNTAASTGAGIYGEASIITLTAAHVGGTGVNEANQLGPDGYTGVGLSLHSGTQATLNDTVISGNVFQTAGFTYGGGAYVTGGTVLTLTTSSLDSHVAPSVTDGRGAGIYANGSTVTLDDSDIVTNTAGTVGGGLRLFNGATLNILNDSQIVNNQALNAEGGAVAAGGASDINIADATLRENTAGGDGGAIYTDGGTLDFTGGWVLRQNTAGANGGAVAAVGDAVASFTAGSYSLVYFNRAEGGHGGMVYLGNSSMTELHAVAGSQMYIYANYASENGGALYAGNGGYFDVYGQVSFDHNRADNGGAIYLSNGSQVWLDDYMNVGPQLWDNLASVSGGAIYAIDSLRVECDGASFGKGDEGNLASMDGGAIHVSGSSFDADNCVFENNQAGQHGGAIAGYDARLAIRASYPAITASAEPSARERGAIGPAAVRSTPCDPLTGQCSALYGNVADSDENNTGDGGAIYVSDSTLRVDQTTLHRNSATRGGAIYQAGAAASAQVANSLIYSNTVREQWGAGIRRSSGAFTVTHTTLANNLGGSGFSGVASAAFNTIAWSNDGYPGFSTAPVVAECNIDDGGYAGLSADPHFVAPGPGEDYRLGGGSPAIDACADGLAVDLDGVPRPIGSGYDMGAYEYAIRSVFLPLVIRGD